MKGKIIAMILTAIMILNPVMALDLGDYPAPFCVDGECNFYAVFGEDAATADVAGAVDVGVRLAAESYDLVTTTGVSGESVSGEGAKLSTPGNEMTPWESAASVKGIFTATDLPTMLKTQAFSAADGGSYEYKQYLYVASNKDGTAATTPAQIKFERPTTENTPRISFKTPASQYLYSYKLAFSTPVTLSSATATSSLREILQGTTLNMLGQDFVISDCTWVATYGIDDLTLLGGKEVVTIGSDEDKTITVDGEEFTIHLSSVLAETVGATTYYTAVGDINGVGFTLRAGNTVAIEGVTFGAIKVLRSGIAGGIDYVKMAAGAEKIKVARSGTVTKGTTTESRLTATITATIASGWSAFALEYKPSVDAWLSEGGSVTEVFASTFSIKFNSISPAFDDAKRQTISFTPSGANMLLTYKNAAGNEKQMYTLYYDSGTWRWASVAAGSPTNYDNNWRDVVFDEASNISAVEQDYFVIQKAGFSHHLQFTSFTPATNELIFTDEAGNSITATNTSSKADLIVDGNVYKVFIVDETKKIVQIDLNGDGYFMSTADASYTSYANNVGREYSFLMPEKITTGQGGLYFYKGNKTSALTVGTEVYPELGFAGIKILRNADNTTSVATYASGSWTNETTTVAAPTPGVPKNVTYTKNYLDFIVNCWASPASMWCNVALGSGTATNQATESEMKTDTRGFVLIEEALEGATAHNWIFLPVAYDSTNSRTYITTPVSDNSNYANIGVVGTSTEYKGMTTYGTLVEYLSSTLGGSATVKYPDTFMYANVYVLAPEAKVTTTATAGETVKKAVPITDAVAQLDTEIPDPSTVSRNLLLVGGSCVNDHVQQLVDDGKLDEAYTCTGGPGEGWVEDEGYIFLVEDGFKSGYDVVVAAGTTRVESRLVCSVLQRYEDFLNKLDGKTAVKVTGTITAPVITAV